MNLQQAFGLNQVKDIDLGIGRCEIIPKDTAAYRLAGAVHGTANLDLKRTPHNIMAGTPELIVASYSITEGGTFKVALLESSRFKSFPDVLGVQENYQSYNLASGTVTVSGTITAGNTITVTVNNVAVTHAVVANDTIDGIAQIVANLLNQNMTLDVNGVPFNNGFQASVNGAVITISATSYGPYFGTAGTAVSLAASTAIGTGASNTLTATASAANLALGTAKSIIGVQITASLTNGVFIEYDNISSTGFSAENVGGNITYTEGVDYFVDYVRGIFYALPGGQITQGEVVVLSFSQNQPLGSVQFGGVVAFRQYALRWIHQRPSDGIWEVIRMHQVIPSGNFAKNYIQNNQNTVEWEWELQADPSRAQGDEIGRIEFWQQQPF